MEKYLKAIFDFTKLPSKFFFLLSITSGFILFAKHQFITDKLFLENVKTEYGWIVGLVFILTSGLVFINFVIWVIRAIRRKIQKYKYEKRLTERVKSLDNSEKSVLREFVLHGQQSLQMPLDNETVSGLLSDGILKVNRTFGNSTIMNGMRVPLSMTRSVLQILKNEDLDLSDPPTEEDINSAKYNRPIWTEPYR